MHYEIKRSERSEICCHFIDFQKVAWETRLSNLIIANRIYFFQLFLQKFDFDWVTDHKVMAERKRYSLIANNYPSFQDIGSAKLNGHKYVPNKTSVYIEPESIWFVSCENRKTTMSFEATQLFLMCNLLDKWCERNFLFYRFQMAEK